MPPMKTQMGLMTVTSCRTWPGQTRRNAGRLYTAEELAEAWDLR